MCIIILNKRGTLDKSILENSAKNNPDSAGMMYSINNEVIVEKSLVYQDIIDEYYRVRTKHPNTPIILHFRIATDGDIDLENCHPYPVNNQTHLVHNGILSNYSNRHTAMSDTRLFIADILSHLTMKQLSNTVFLKLIQQAIGSYNKMVLLNNKGDITLLNEAAGIWDKMKENWFSNSSYLPPKPVKTNFIPYANTVKNKVLNNWTRTKWDALPATSVKTCAYCKCSLNTTKEKRTHLCSYCDQEFVKAIEKSF